MVSLETSKKLQEMIAHLEQLQVDDLPEEAHPQVVDRIVELLSQAADLCDKLEK